MRNFSSASHVTFISVLYDPDKRVQPRRIAVWQGVVNQIAENQGRQQPKTAVMVLGVVPGEEDVAVGPDVLDRAEPVR